LYFFSPINHWFQGEIFLPLYLNIKYCSPSLSLEEEGEGEGEDKVNYPSGFAVF
jgi:hypothetical protein